MSDPDFDKVPTASAPVEPSRAEAYGTVPQGVPITSTPHLWDYIKVLHKRRWLVIVPFVLISVATGVQSYSAINVYSANVKLLIEMAQPNYTQFQDVGAPGAEWSLEYLETQYDLLKSRSLARKTLDRLNLWDNMPPRNAPKAFSLMEVAMKPVGWVTGLLKSEAPPVAPTEDSAAQAETRRESRAIDALLGMLSVTPVRNSRVVTLSARSFDPKLATEVVNAHATQFIEQNTEFKFETSTEATRWLNERLAEQRKEVDKAEAALQAYRESHSTIPPEDSQNITVQKLSQLSTAYTTARLAMLDKEVVFKQLEAIGNDEAALAAFPPILSNAIIQAQKTELAGFRRNEDELLQTLDINHPRVKTVRTSIESAEAKIKTEMQNVVKAIRTDYGGIL